MDSRRGEYRHTILTTHLGACNVYLMCFHFLNFDAFIKVSCKNTISCQSEIVIFKRY